MSWNRRDLLKHFAVGTVIVPAAAAVVADNTPQARLIELPEVEPVTLVTSSEPIDFGAIAMIDMSLVMKNGTTRRLMITQVAGGRATGGQPIETVRRARIRMSLFGLNLETSPAEMAPIAWLDGKVYPR